MTISTIILDLGGVMVWTHWENMTKPLAKRSGLTPDQVMDEVRRGDAYNPFMRGEFDKYEFHRRMTRQFSLDIQPDELFAIWNSIIQPHHEIAPIVNALRQRYRLVSGSSTDPLHYQAGLDVQPLLEHVEEGILSYQIGHLKPDAEFFTKGLEGLDISAVEAFFIDDRMENVNAAQNVGISAIQFTSVAQLDADLRRLGLL